MLQLFLFVVIPSLVIFAIITWINANFKKKVFNMILSTIEEELNDTSDETKRSYLLSLKMKITNQFIKL